MVEAYPSLPLRSAGALNHHKGLAPSLQGAAAAGPVPKPVHEASPAHEVAHTSVEMPAHMATHAHAEQAMHVEQEMHAEQAMHPELAMHAHAAHAMHPCVVRPAHSPPAPA
jgi:hypothetical protein